jgi:BON domain-containing protein
VLACRAAEGIARAVSGATIEKKGGVEMRGMAWMRSLVAVGLALGVAAPALAQSPPPPVMAASVEPGPPVTRDEMIVTTIQARLKANILLRFAQISISSKYGVVTLAGMVPTDWAHEQALDVARTTLGVLRIDDQLRLIVNSPSSPMQN